MISLCMIALNDAAAIARALASCVGAVDEAIVVDLGSTDGTTDAARRAGARIVSATLEGGFAEARNRAFDVARGEFTLWLEANETLRPASVPLVREAVALPSACGLTVIRTDPAGRSTQPLRIAKSACRLRWRGRVHESLVCPIESIDTGIRLNAAGPARPIEPALHRRLLEAELRDAETLGRRDGHVGFLRADLAVRLRLSHDPRWPAESARAASGLDAAAPRPPHALAGPLLRMLLDRPTPGMPPSVVAELAERWFPEHLELLVARLQWAIDNERFGEALTLSNRAMAAGDPPERWFHDVDELRADVHLLTGHACVGLTHHAAATEQYQLAARYKPTRVQALAALERLAAKAATTRRRRAKKRSGI